MIIEVDVPDYSRERGLRMKWEDGTRIEVKRGTNSTIIRANREGLLSLARLMLTLATEEVPKGCHWHLDELNSLEEGSQELVVDKI